ncbi:nucleotide-binding protein [Shewanella abyssi]|uniref:TIR domain-containing protein n=1 Tax=Shewanella abyssi TaxID=311789 RepID=UPI00200BBDDB|nr:nucleotide-binding protein [Shewanella abyssi]MCL1049159.1 nucleotide-binding protein [Shewanella abyssi]
MPLDVKDQRVIETYFEMDTGYVLHYSNRTFADFFEQFDIDIEIYNDKYSDMGGSKAKRLRSLFNQQDDEFIGQVILGLIDENDTDLEIRNCSHKAGEKLYNLRLSALEVASRLINSTGVAVPPQTQQSVNPFNRGQKGVYIAPRQAQTAQSRTLYTPTKQAQPSATETPSAWDLHKRTATTTQNQPMTNTSAPSKEKVFIVHGHDEHLLSETENLIRRLDLDPIILKDQHSGGKTIIEKLEQNSKVKYAIILYTACDEGRKSGTGELNKRARQNVVFEHGYFIGLLGRENVAALVKDDVEIQGDIGGVVYIPYAGAWRFDLAKEMKQAGLKVDLNHL